MDPRLNKLARRRQAHLLDRLPSPQRPEPGDFQHLERRRQLEREHDGRLVGGDAHPVDRARLQHDREPAAAAAGMAASETPDV